MVCGMTNAKLQQLDCMILHFMSIGLPREYQAWITGKRENLTEPRDQLVNIIQVAR